jgi:hypothetical protein
MMASQKVANCSKIRIIRHNMLDIKENGSYTIGRQKYTIEPLA